MILENKLRLENRRLKVSMVMILMRNREKPANKTFY